MSVSNITLTPTSFNKFIILFSFIKGVTWYKFLDISTGDDDWNPDIVFWLYNICFLYL